MLIVSHSDLDMSHYLIRNSDFEEMSSVVDIYGTFRDSSDDCERGLIIIIIITNFYTGNILKKNRVQGLGNFIVKVQCKTHQQMIE